MLLKRPFAGGKVPSFKAKHQLCAGSKQPRLTRPTAFAPTAPQPTLPEEVHDKQEYRRGIGICLVNSKGQVFAARRADDCKRTWQMPQGGIDPLENPMIAAQRELKEETGISNACIVAQIDRWLDYEFPTKIRSQLTGSWVRYRGQTQKWFLMHFHGDESEIDLEAHGSPEFVEYTWIAIEQLPEEVVDFKRAVYSQVAQEFAPIIECLAEQK